MNFFGFFLLFPLLLLLIVIVAVLSVRWERRYRARQEQGASTGPSAVQETVTALQNKLQAWQSHLPALDRFKNGLRSQPLPDDLPARFLAWADNALTDDPALQRWLRQLPPQGQLIITHRLAAFCTDIGFELLWLLDRHLALDEAVQAGAQQVVRNYCRACYEAVPIFADLQLLRPYLLLKETPTDRAHRPFGQQLYAQLVTAGLAAPLPADSALAAEHVRWGHVTQAIDQAVATHPTEFAAIVKGITQAESAPQPASTPEPVAH